LGVCVVAHRAGSMTISGEPCIPVG
jgi:hypothetical protein